MKMNSGIAESWKLVMKGKMRAGKMFSIAALPNTNRKIAPNPPVMNRQRQPGHHRTKP